MYDFLRHTRGIIILILLAVLMSTPIVWSDSSKAEYHLKKDDFSKVFARDISASAYTIMLNHFRYRGGDQEMWASPEYDDSYWPVVNSGFHVDGLPDGKWPGIGWFRAKLSIPAELVNVPLFASVLHMGAIEIYLDGDLVENYGVVSSDPLIEQEFINSQYKPAVFQLPDTLEHTLAIRYSNTQSVSFFRHDINHGFNIIVSKYTDTIDDAIDFIRLVTGHNIAFTVAPFLLGLIHFILFIYYPKARGNLYFGLFALSLAVLPFSFVIFELSSSYANFKFANWLMKISIVVMSVFGVAFLHAVFYDKLLKIFYVFAMLGLLVLLLSWWLPLEPIYFFSMATLTEVLRATLIAVKRRKPGSWILGLGISCFIVTTVYVMLVDSSIISTPSLNSYFFYLYGMAMLVLSMSVYLGWDFARTNKQLELQIIQVKELSDKTLEQERVAKENQMKQAILETEISHRRKEAEKARELAEALNSLEKAHRELQDTQSQLIQSEKMASLGQLVAGIAHEINTPVGAVSSMHNTSKRAIDKLKKDMLDACNDDDQKAQFEKAFKVIEDTYKVIDDGTGRVVNIVRRLKSFARLDEAKLKSVDIHEGIEDTLTLIYHEIKHGIKINREFSKVPHIACYPGQLNQVFLNMLINAKQAIRGEGKISIKTYISESKVYIKISDTGVGIEKDNLNKIFDPGFTTKGVGVGTGLGLSICYQIIREHLGEIEVESEKGAGTTFTIIIPANLDQLLNEMKNNG